MARLAAVPARVLLGGVVLTVLVAALLFLVWPMPEVERLGGGPILDTRFMASGSDAPEYLAALGERGRRLYALFAVADMAWAVLHGLTVAACTAVGVSRSRLDDRLVVLATVPLAYLALDLVENASVLAALAAHPRPPPVPAGLLDVVTSLKFLSLGVAYAGLLVGLVAWARAARGQGASRRGR